MSSVPAAVEPQDDRTRARHRSVPAWNRCVALLAVAVVAYFQTWVDLWPFWEEKNATYTHGTLIVAVTLWLVWRARAALTGVAPRTEPKVLPFLLLLSATWMLATRANLFIVYAVLWPLLAFTMIWTGVGRRTAIKMVFPLSFLYFAIPVWDYLKPPLQMITSTMVGLLSGLAGVPAAVDGPYVTLPTGTIYIALDCSGAHFLCVALAVGVLAGVIRGDVLATRLLIVGLAGLLSMVFNWVRILLILFAYLHPDLKHSLETIGHFTFGWWVFALDLVVFALVLRLVPSSNTTDVDNPAVDHGSIPRAGIGGIALTAACALLLPVSVWALPRLDAPDRGAVPRNIAPSLGSRRETRPDARWTPRFVGATWEYRTAYLGTEGRTIEVYGNEYQEQSQGSELIPRGSPLFERSVFTPISTVVVSLSPRAGAPIRANRMEMVDNSRQQWVGVYTYFVDDTTIASPYGALFLSAFRSLYGHPTAGVVAVAMPCVPHCGASAAELADALVVVYAAHRHAGAHLR